MKNAKGESIGVSVDLFCAVEKQLRRKYRGKIVRIDQATWNRWIALIGQVEREYAELARAGEKAEKSQTATKELTDAAAAATRTGNRHDECDSGE